MEALAEYDPDADLALLRGNGNSRVAVWVLFVLAVFVLGTYLQMLPVGMTLPFRLWLHGKLAVIALLVVAALRTSKVHSSARVLFPVAAVLAFLEGSAWIVVLTVYAVAFSCFAYLVVPASLVALVFTPLVSRAIAAADAARDRLVANGLDDPFA